MPNGNGDPKRKAKKKKAGKAKKASVKKTAKPKKYNGEHKPKAIGNSKVVQELYATTGGGGNGEPKVGRPKAEINWETVEKLAMIQCTQKEIAEAVGVDIKTLTSREEFFPIYKKGREYGKMSLRRHQWKSVEAGNVAMQIFLGKQYLEQTDKPGMMEWGGKVEHEHYGTVDYSGQDADELRECLRALRGAKARRGREAAAN